jgi:FOG: GAF domain
MINTFGKDIIPDNEQLRLKALYQYTLLDTLPDNYFNNLAYIVAQFFQTPIALISLVENESVFFKGNVGMEGVLKVDRGSSLCALAILNFEVTVFTDTLNEPCLLTNPLIRGKFGLRFYAGAPLITPSGYPIGTLCIIDKKPRNFENKERDLLNRFANIAMHEFEMRIIHLQ